MPTWTVEVPAWVTLQVEADTDEQAIELALNGPALSEQVKEGDGLWSVEADWDNATAERNEP